MKIAIVLATYEPNPGFFDMQIRSLSEQTVTDWTCFLTDDGSSPAGRKTIEKSLLDDPRFITAFHPDRVGSYLNFERGLGAVPKDFDLICLCDQDDVWVPDKLETMAAVFVDSQVVLSHSDLALIDGAGKRLHASCWTAERRNTGVYDPELLLLRNNVTGCSAVFRRQLLESALPFPKPEQERRFHHDLWIALVASVSGRIIPVPRPLVLYRQHGENVVGASISQLRPTSVESGTFSGKVRSKLRRTYEDFQWREELSHFLVDRMGKKAASFSSSRALWKAVTTGYQASWISLRMLIGDLSKRFLN